MKRLLAEACELVDSDESVPLAELKEALDTTNHLVQRIILQWEREMIASTTLTVHPRRARKECCIHPLNTTLASTGLETKQKNQIRNSQVDYC